MAYAKATPRVLRKIIRDKYVKTPSAGRRLHSNLSLLFDYAVETDRIETNPMLGVVRFVCSSIQV